MRVDADALVGAEDLNLLGLAFDELLKFRWILKVVDEGRHAGQFVSVEGVHGGANLLEQCRHVEFRGLADAAAQHDDAVQHAGRLRDGIARRLAETGESFHGGLLVAVKSAVGNAVYVVRVCISVGFFIMREFTIIAQHRTEGNAFLGDELLPPLAGSAVNLGAAVVTHKHLVVGSYADTKSCPEDETDQILVLFHTARIADFFVQHRQCAG